MALFCVFPDSAHVALRNPEKRCEIMQRHLLEQFRFGCQQFVIAFFGRHRQQINSVIVDQANLSLEQIVIELTEQVVFCKQIFKGFQIDCPKNRVNDRLDIFSRWRLVQKAVQRCRSRMPKREIRGFFYAVNCDCVLQNPAFDETENRANHTFFYQILIFFESRPGKIPGDFVQ